MARAKSGSTDDTLIGGLRSSPETKRLAEEARHLLDAQLTRATSKLGDSVSGATDKLTQLGESGSLPSLGAGAKKLLGGVGPVGSALGAATSGVADRAKGLIGRKDEKGGKGGGEPKAVNIEESIDIGVPVSVAYDQWTQFTEFSRFTKGVESVEQLDDTEMNWRAKVFKSRRTWKAKILEQVPDRRVVWRSEGSKATVNGVVTFHPLADDLTRVLVALEYYPSGLVEKTGNLWRAAGRRTRLDLKEFRRFVMLQNEPTGAWRGEIREGKVAKAPGKRARSEGPSESRSAKPRKRTSTETSQKAASDSAKRTDTSRSRPRKSTAESRPRKSASTSPAKKSSSSGRSSRAAASGSQSRKAPSASTRKSTSESRRPRKSSKQSSSSGSARKASTSSRSSRKQTAKRAPARKSTSKK